MKNYKSLIVWILISFIPSFIGAFYRPGAWYLEIVKPEWTPPGWIFGPVWTMLYLSMAVAVWLVWIEREKTDVKLPITIFSVHLVFNAMWSWLFFGLQNIGLAAVEIIVLWAMIILTIIFFYRVKKIAGLILIPYLLWVSFASFLNFTIWNLNRSY